MTQPSMPSRLKWIASVMRKNERLVQADRTKRWRGKAAQGLRQLSLERPVVSYLRAQRLLRAQLIQMLSDFRLLPRILKTSLAMHASSSYFNVISISSDDLMHGPSKAPAFLFEPQRDAKTSRWTAMGFSLPRGMSHTSFRLARVREERELQLDSSVATTLTGTA